MKVAVAPRATLLELPLQNVEIPAGEAREVAWTVTAPTQLAFTRFEALLWEIEAKDSVSGARDALKAQPAPHPRRAADRAAGHAGADRRPVQPARGAAGRRSGHERHHPGRPQAGAATQAGRPGACPACATGSPATPSPAWSRRPASPSACATASSGRAWCADARPTWTATAWPATSRRARATARAAATSSPPTCWPPRTRPPA
jgi:hypothetical protein